MKTCTLGADPEMFVRRKPNTTTPVGDIVPICGLVGGTKDKPLPFKKLGHVGYAYQEDNVSFEVNIPPSTNKNDFDIRISKVLEESKALLKDKGLVLDFKRSAHRFNAKELTSDQAQTIGCDPDMCAYGGANDIPIARPPFEIKDLGTWRYTGGHIHFGWDKEKIDIPEHVMVRLIDAVVYLPIIKKDKQKMRRSKYGLAGLYRPKEYGVEYRSMSNFWLLNPQMVSGRAFNLLLDLAKNTDALCDFYQALPIEKIQKCINESGEGAEKLWVEVMKCTNFWQLQICNNGRESTTTAFAQGVG